MSAWVLADDRLIRASVQDGNKSETKTMKKHFLIIFCSIMMIPAMRAQDAKATDVLARLEAMPDQFNKKFDSKGIDDKLTIIYIPGTNNPFEKFYFKSKAAKTKPDVLLVGGFDEMMNSMSYETKLKHLQDALSARYPKGSRVMIDMTSEVGKLLSTRGYTIVTISKKQNRVMDLRDFGFDRVAFFDALKEYENTSNG